MVFSMKGVDIVLRILVNKNYSILDTSDTFWKISIKKRLRNIISVFFNIMKNQKVSEVVNFKDKKLLQLAI